jgi:hypothetical protein
VDRPPPRHLAVWVEGHGEVQASFKTTEFWIYLLAVGGVLLASFLVDSGDGGRGYVSEPTRLGSTSLF